MNNSYFMLCIAFFPVSAFARCWIVRRLDSRPLGLSNETLQLLGATALLSLLAGCFFMLNVLQEFGRPIAVFAAGILYDFFLRWFFLEREVRRTARAHGCRRSVARERVRRRAGYRRLGEWLPLPRRA